MKKIVAALVALMLLAGCFGSIAEGNDLGINLIPNGEVEEEVVSLDDLKLEESYKINGYAIVKPLGFYYIDYFAQFNKGKNGDVSADTSSANSDRVFTATDSWNGGETAEYAIFKVDIVNLGKADIGFMAEAEVKVVYADEYEFKGWVRQINYDYVKRVYARITGGKHDGHSPVDDSGHYFTALMLEPTAEEPVGVMYTGHYVFGCTLPNEAITSAEPLKIVITLGENEMTYNIRK